MLCTKMVNCSIRNCKSRSEKGGTIRFYSFPKKESVANEWLRYCGLKTTCKYGRVCSKHFASTDYTKSLRHILMNVSPKSVRKLKEDAIPTIEIDSVEKSKSTDLTTKSTVCTGGQTDNCETIENYDNSAPSCNISLKDAVHLKCTSDSNTTPAKHVEGSSNAVKESDKKITVSEADRTPANNAVPSLNVVEKRDDYCGPVRRRLSKTAIPTKQILHRKSETEAEVETAKTRRTVEIELMPLKREQSDGDISEREIKEERQQEISVSKDSCSNLIKIEPTEPSTSKTPDLPDLTLVKQEKVTDDESCDAVQDETDITHSVSVKRKRIDLNEGDYPITIKNIEKPRAKRKPVGDPFPLNDQDIPEVRKLKLELKRAHDTIRMRSREAKQFREKSRRLTRKVTKFENLIQSLRGLLLNKAPKGSMDVESDTSDSEDFVTN